MPAIVQHDTPFTPRSTPTPRDWELIWILVAIGVILFLEVVLAIVWIRKQNLNSKARWKRLRDRGIVVGVSYLNLRKTAESSRYNVNRGNEEWTTV
ncbi:hypothetical protein FB567DRAFT_592610 [Paraphoma chrysanthemicola]|uniref:Uncharacterized protein n=1 Tax=Paraphoma chrysanthemicola TaxID=798071 RepID=A0A8K0VXI2_9PLEO|nr:hypothetical protein FB567DRAFT_592610 [Paraphoma chrysanthemicola]